jgi:hypothetical protein
MGSGVKPRGATATGRRKFSRLRLLGEDGRVENQREILEKSPACRMHRNLQGKNKEKWEKKAGLPADQ